jgi:hypothetical protein
MIDLIELVQVALTFTDQLRGERPGPITRDIDSELADLRGDRLRGRAVTRVRTLGLRCLALLIAQMPSQLSAQPALERGFEQRRQQPFGPSDRHLPGIDLGEQIIQRTAGLQLSNELVA